MAIRLCKLDQNRGSYFGGQLKADYDYDITNNITHPNGDIGDIADYVKIIIEFVYFN